VNGLAGREGELPVAPSPAPKHVLVVGGGPAGLEVARLASLRGHRVTLYERDRFLGGAFLMACVVHPENAPFLDFLVREVARLPIEVRRGRAITAADVRRRAPDAVVVATGGRLAVPSIPGDHRPHVVTGASLRRMLAGDAPGDELSRLPAWQRWGVRRVAGPLSRWATPDRVRALAKAWMPVGRRVAIVGADLAALELAEFLATRGRRVTVVEPGGRLAPEVGLKRLTEHMDRLDRLGVAVNTGVDCEEITDEGIRIRPESGGGHLVRAETVIVAGALEPDTALFDAVKSEVPEAHAIGDCTGLGLVRKATEEATRVASAL
jgi:2,4-dienoyl-CoA reductase (NADPH2)